MTAGMQDMTLRHYESKDFDLIVPTHYVNMDFHHWKNHYCKLLIKLHTNLLRRRSRQRGQVVKAPGSGPTRSWFKNSFAPFCCVLGKNTFPHFSLLGGLGKQF